LGPATGLQDHGTERKAISCGLQPGEQCGTLPGCAECGHAEVVFSESRRETVISDAQQDNSKQIAQVETFIRQKPDLLIVAPNERAALTAIMGQAMEAGIPLICLERDVLQPNYTSYVHSDNTAIGRKAGQFIVDSLTKKHGSPRGTVVAIRGLLGVEAEIEPRHRRQEIFAKYPDIRIVAEPVADWISSEGQRSHD